MRPLSSAESRRGASSLERTFLIQQSSALLLSWLAGAALGAITHNCTRTERRFDVDKLNGTAAAPLFRILAGLLLLLRWVRT